VFSLCAMTVVGEEQRQTGERTLRSAGGEAEEDTLVHRVGFPPSSRSPLGSPSTTLARVNRVSLHILQTAPILDDGFDMPTSQHRCLCAHRDRSRTPL
jgi:hypothetical protein